LIQDSKGVLHSLTDKERAERSPLPDWWPFWDAAKALGHPEPWKLYEEPVIYTIWTNMYAEINAEVEKALQPKPDKSKGKRGK
jgi:hypothetical protein